jgi:hypothetical protein
MNSVHLRRPSPALAIACIALFVALGGTGYAVVNLPRNSVGTKHLKRNAVTSPKLRDNAVRGADVNEATLGIVPNADALDGLDSSAFIRPEGLMLVTSGSSAWQLSEPGGGTTIDYVVGEAVVTASGAVSNEHVVLSPDLPAAVYGRQTLFVGAEVCYDATEAGVFVDIITLRRFTYSTDTAGVVASSINDGTNRNDETCRLYTFPTPPVLGAEDAVQLSLSLDYTSAASFRVGRATFILQATGVPATAPS